MSVPGVTKIYAACRELQAAANELRAAEHDGAVIALAAMTELLGSWIARITIEHSKRNAAVQP